MEKSNAERLISLLSNFIIYDFIAKQILFKSDLRRKEIFF